jgi:hypothetical protein
VNILFDAMCVQVQVQQQTHNRLTTWFSSLKSLGYRCLISDYRRPLADQLAGIHLLVSLTRQQAYPGPGPQGPIGNDVCFSFTHSDLAYLQTWVQNGGRILAFTNHSNPWGSGPWSPLFEIQLGAIFGIPLSFAEFLPGEESPMAETHGCPPTPARILRMSPNPAAPASIIKGVTTLEACDSGGIGPLMPGVAPRPGIASGTEIVLVPLPRDCKDTSGLGYQPDTFAFAALYPIGKGSVIVIGHSGMAGNTGSCSPSPGQIGSADNETFLNNCVAYAGEAS